MSEGTTRPRVEFETSGRTLHVSDELEGKSLRIELDAPQGITAALTELFPFPTDRAVAVEARSLSIPAYAHVSLRDASGDLLEHVVEATEVPRDTYLVELSGAVKAYLLVEDAAVTMTGASEPGPVRVDFDGPTRVVIGGRSRHSRPEATITVPDDPAAVATAVSHFGSAIKEFSPERSWPTLRGHPPRIRRGDALDVPDGLAPPDTGVRITVPETFAAVYRVTPLAYYLGATVETVPGGDPTLHVGDYAESLATATASFERRAARLLDRCLLLDSLVRVAGYSPSSRYEYDELGPELPFYPPNLYELPTAERLLEYFEPDWATLSPFVPPSPTVAVLRDRPADAELLPYLAYTLTHVRVAEPARSAPIALLDEFGSTRSDTTGSGGTARDRVPPGTARLTAETYERRLKRPPGEPCALDALVLTDGVGERLDASIRPDGSLHAELADVDVVHDPDADRVREAFSTDADLLVCDLPSDASGIETADAVVTPGSLPTVAPSVLLFQRTGSTEIVEQLIGQGGLVGVAVEGGIDPDRLSTFLRLLGRGIRVDAGVALAAFEGAVRFVGDPAIQTVNTPQGTPTMVTAFDSEAPDRFRATHRALCSPTHRRGGEYGLMTEWAAESVGLGAPRTEPRTANARQVAAFAGEDSTVVRLDGTVRLPPLTPPEVGEAFEGSEGR